MYKRLQQLEAELLKVAELTTALVDRLGEIGLLLKFLKADCHEPAAPRAVPVKARPPVQQTLPMPEPRDEGKLYVTLPSPWRYIFHRKPDIMEGATIAKTLGMKKTTFFRNWKEAGFPKPVKDGGQGRGNKTLWAKKDVIKYLEETTGDDRLPPILPSWEKK